MEVRNGPTHQLSIRVVSRKDRFGWSMDIFLCILKMLRCQKSSNKLKKNKVSRGKLFPRSCDKNLFWKNKLRISAKKISLNKTILQYFSENCFEKIKNSQQKKLVGYQKINAISKKTNLIFVYNIFLDIKIVVKKIKYFNISMYVVIPTQYENL